MFKVNEYFDGTVKSIAFGTAEGPATIGVTVSYTHLTLPTSDLV